MLAKISIIVAKKADGSYDVIDYGQKPAEVLDKIAEAIESGEYVAAGLVRNPRLKRLRRLPGGVEIPETEPEPKEPQPPKTQEPKGTENDSKKGQPKK